jgi:hypothetical protein
MAFGSGSSTTGGLMSVLARFNYEVKPGRMDDFLAKLALAGSSKFVSPVMPKSFKLFRCTLPGPDTGRVILHIEYEDMAAYGARSTYENSNPQWRALFEALPDPPEQLVSVELLTEYVPQGR